MLGKIHVAVVPADQASIGIARRLRRSLVEILGLDVSVDQIAGGFPRQAFNDSRGQYDAYKILSSFEGIQAGLLLLVTDLDLYCTGLNFCFGLAHRRAAIISLHRLRPESYGEPRDENLLVLRAEKEAVHEICHLIGLRHCPSPLCVMHFSNCIGDTDVKRKLPCDACLERIKSTVIQFNP
ncbi:MAG: archaemetzincin family Zn-dependent metalloprotease [Aigarchaeota archaeon]|nr:archaemetzincin family Zn-dependent metalloprotease [Aigarchaeota archaeon]